MAMTVVASKSTAIETIIDRLTYIYRRPVPVRMVDEIKDSMSRFVDLYGGDKATIYDDFEAAMFLRNRTGERIFKGRPY